MDFYDIKIYIRNGVSKDSVEHLLLKSVEEVRKLFDEVKLCGGIESPSSLYAAEDTDGDIDIVFTTAQIETCVRRCLEEPNLVHCEWFREFLTSKSHSSRHHHEDGNHLLSTDCLSTSSTACDFVLQPFDNEVMYVPRRKSFFMDYSIAAGNSLVYSFGRTSTNISVKAHFQPTETENDSAIELEGSVSTGGSYEAATAGIMRLTFDNSCSLFRGNYVEYCVQCVPAQTMHAAEKAASDLAEARAHTSSLWTALLNSSSTDCFNVHVDVHVDVEKDDYDAAAEQQQQPDSTPAAAVDWMTASSQIALNTLCGGLPFVAGKLSTIGLSGFHTIPAPETQSSVTAQKCSKSNNVDDDNDNHNERLLALERMLKSENQSELCTVCGSCSVQDMLCLARQIDTLREEGCLERALSSQAIATEKSKSRKEMREKDVLINKIGAENASLRLKCSNFEVLHLEAAKAEEKNRLEMNDAHVKHAACYERLCSLQKEAGVWSEARDRVEEELYFLSDSREREGQAARALVDQCASLQRERKELLQHIADLEQRLVTSPPLSGPCSSSTAASSTPAVDLVETLQTEILALAAQKDIDDKKFSMLQSEFQAFVMSSRSDISEAKMLQYHFQ